MNSLSLNLSYTTTKKSIIFKLSLDSNEITYTTPSNNYLCTVPKFQTQSYRDILSDLIEIGRIIVAEVKVTNFIAQKLTYDFVNEGENQNVSNRNVKISDNFILDKCLINLSI